jgi:hypothetical protein
MTAGEPVGAHSETRRVSARMAGWVDEALERLAPGEDIAWETGLVPNGTGLTVVLVLWTPSPVLGELVLTYTALADPVRNPQDQSLVDDLVRSLVEQLRHASSEALKRGLEQLPAPHTANGSGQPAPHPFLRP